MTAPGTSDRSSPEASARDAPHSPPVLSLQRLSVSLPTPDDRAHVVKDLSFTVERGHTLGLVGESGCGKSMTCLALMGLLRRQRAVVTGRALLGGVDLLALRERQLRSVRGRRIAMVFQDPMSSLNPAFTVGDQISGVIRAHNSVTRSVARKRAIEMLSQVGIPNAARRSRSYPHEFSGGMRQRAMLAMALSCSPELLIADEPTTALDVTIQAQILQLLRSMQQEYGLAILFVTHDMGVVAEICDQVVVMYAGRCVEQAPVHDLFAKPRHPYSDALLRATPHIAPGATGLWSLPGTPPRVADVSPGCSFAPRCTFATDLCQVEAPELEQSTRDAFVRCHHAASLDFSGDRP